jgi:hydrogenase expression/formation protein HypE
MQALEMSERTDPKPAYPNVQCAVPLSDGEYITLAHGAGGRAMRDLIEGVFAAAFSPCGLQAQRDAALVQTNGARLAFTTDSFVVKPLQFPGGDIGSLAVYGTVNDLAMQGARPLWLSAAFIIEEGFSISLLRDIVASMREAAERTGVAIVTGDTKVLERGKGDGLFINTAGVGIVEHCLELGPERIRDGDAVLLNGDLGRHGIAVMAAREGFAFESVLNSDLAPLSEITSALLDSGVEVHCMRDLTRGGLASALNEIAHTAHLRIALDEPTLPVSEPVRGVCELLGLDPLYVANEGRFVAVVRGADAGRALDVLRSTPLGTDACIIGRVAGDAPPPVTIRTALGVERILDMLSGDQLPRIC